MEPRWWGPATVIARTSHSSYTIGFEGGDTEVHIDDLKEYEVDEFEGEGDNFFTPNFLRTHKRRARQGRSEWRVSRHTGQMP